jgi:hypothetical protein
MIVACEKFKKNNPNHIFVGISCLLLKNFMGMLPVLVPMLVAVCESMDRTELVQDSDGGRALVKCGNEPSGSVKCVESLD